MRGINEFIKVPNCSSVKNLINKSLLHREIPVDWKSTNVVPIFKKDSKGDKNNYRPVSLTSIVGKLLESIIKNHV